MPPSSLNDLRLDVSAAGRVWQIREGSPNLCRSRFIGGFAAPPWFGGRGFSFHDRSLVVKVPIALWLAMRPARHGRIGLGNGGPPAFVLGVVRQARLRVRVRLAPLSSHFDEIPIWVGGGHSKV